MVHEIWSMVLNSSVPAADAGLNRDARCGGGAAQFCAPRKSPARAISAWACGFAHGVGMVVVTVCMLAVAGCNGPGRALGEDQRPADDLTDEELIERCATASPDEEGLGCPDGCVTVDLYEGHRTPTITTCYGSSAEYIQVCAPTRGTSLERGTEVLDPGHPGLSLIHI